MTTHMPLPTLLVPTIHSDKYPNFDRPMNPYLLIPMALPLGTACTSILAIINNDRLGDASSSQEERGPARQVVNSVLKITVIVASFVAMIAFIASVAKGDVHTLGGSWLVSRLSATYLAWATASRQWTRYKEYRSLGLPLWPWRSLLFLSVASTALNLILVGWCIQRSWEQ